MRAILPSLVILISPLALGVPLARANVGGGGAASAAPVEFGAERPVARVAPHVQRQEVWQMPASPAQIFPLLCPVLEYDWIPSWRAKLIHSASGVAEKGCIFETRFPRDGRATWVCTHYEPPTRIEYTIFQANGVLARLEIALRATDDGTEMRWNRTWHALDENGEATLRAWDEEAFLQMSRGLQALLRHYLETGTMLRPSAAK